MTTQAFNLCGEIFLTEVWEPIKVTPGVTKEIEFSTGAKIYMKNGKCHNLDGPAIVKPDGSVHFYIEGISIPIEHWVKHSTLDDMEKAHIILTHC